MRHLAFEETLTAVRVCSRLGFHSGVAENRTKCPQMILRLGIQLSKGTEKKGKRAQNGRLICVLIGVDGKQRTKSECQTGQRRPRAVGPHDGAARCVCPPVTPKAFQAAAT